MSINREIWRKASPLNRWARFEQIPVPHELKPMKEVLARCGYRCDLCLAYKPNVEANPDNPKRLSEGWNRYFSLRVPTEKILYDGCLAKNQRLQDQDRPVRLCVIERNLPNCSECESYVCEKLTQRLVFFEEIQKAQEAPIPEENRRSFILPYENGARLEAYRKHSYGSGKEPRLEDEDSLA